MTQQSSGRDDVTCMIVKWRQQCRTGISLFWLQPSYDGAVSYRGNRSCQWQHTVQIVLHITFGQKRIKVCNPPLCVLLVHLNSETDFFWFSFHGLFHTGDLHMFLLVQTTGEGNSDVSHSDLDCSHTVCSSCCTLHYKLRCTERFLLSSH